MPTELDPKIKNYAKDASNPCNSKAGTLGSSARTGLDGANSLMARASAGCSFFFDRVVMAHAGPFCANIPKS
ncbi:MAG: hypothetical protein DMG13_24380 [Acidobacteria bacterium]|nr:MAG: hypothetical protein DMG13_24380 [Acidobacteriota bacterium]